MKSYEFWVEEDDQGSSYLLRTAEQMDDERTKGLVGPKAKLMFRIQAETYEEAKAVQNIKLGWSPYVPNGKAACCPHDCGGVFYPAGYHECPNCGPISPDLCQRILDEQDKTEEAPVHPVIKFMENTDTPSLTLNAYSPGDPTDFACTFGLTIGPTNDQGGEQFYLKVCSPKWLTRACEKDGFVWGRHHLIVPEYNLAAIMKVITKFVENCSGGSWQEVAARLSRIAAWEFENYQA